ncbi:head-tail connector protein [Halomonas organivorans]|uniref:Putative phiE125 gp8 family phage protein n=1 Tax=Halomonas organivorans TaxID=257772 RepID=A0A7W5C1C4_9GAMM|nr:head-tail connector protein [Halomonas organivorans]MBB3142822.1 putative phiE125 gp8 family phage protein [Halomonas organivorans]
MITLAEAKLHLRLITSPDEAESYTAEDGLIQALIDAAYRHAEERTRQVFQQVERTLALDGFPAGDGAIALPWTPVASVDSVDYIDPAGTNQSLDANALRLDARPLYPTLAPQWGSEWPSTIDEPESVTLTATTGPDTTPPDVRAALLLLIGHFYENREAVAIGTIATDIPLGVEMLLAPHIIHAVG